MSEPDFKELRLAVLVDADNIPALKVKEMMEEVSKYGTPTFKRIYGDWTNPSLNSWKRLLNEHAITPIQQFSYTTGKNATDSALIIDAMDILYTRRVDGFFIVSSDSDFTRLATRLREEGMRVFGMGQKKTPKPFIKACEKFIYIEVLGAAEAEEAESPAEDRRTNEPRPRRGKGGAAIDRELRDLVEATIEDLTDEDDWLSMGHLGNGLMRKQPDFDPRNYGFKKLSDLVAAMPFLEFATRQSNGQKHFYVRLKVV
jgi:uncharacterized LabA/DUF88 family protein